MDEDNIHNQEEDLLVILFVQYAVNKITGDVTHQMKNKRRDYYTRITCNRRKINGRVNVALNDKDDLELNTEPEEAGSNIKLIYFNNKEDTTTTNATTTNATTTSDISVKVLAAMNKLKASDIVLDTGGST